METRPTKLISYEHPTSDVLELALRGILCGSETQNTENPEAPSTVDNIW